MSTRKCTGVGPAKAPYKFHILDNNGLTYGDVIQQDKKDEDCNLRDKQGKCQMPAVHRVSKVNELFNNFDMIFAEARRRGEDVSLLADGVGENIHERVRTQFLELINQMVQASKSGDEKIQFPRVGMEIRDEIRNTEIEDAQANLIDCPFIK